MDTVLRELQTPSKTQLLSIKNEPIISNNLIILHNQKVSTVSQKVLPSLSKTKKSPIHANDILSCFSYSLLWMRAKKQDPNFAFLSLQNTAKMAHENGFKGVNSYCRENLCIRQEMEMRLTKTSWLRQIA